MTSAGSIDTFLRKVAATEPAPAVLRVPAEVGRYRVGARLGRGGLGLVHVAFDPHLGREVALKLVRPDRTGGESGLRLQARLRTEARALARLADPHVVPVFDVGEVNGQVYIVMQKLEGRTLRQWLGERHRSLTEILAVYRQAGEGLAAAHVVGVVHRDFKPDNVLVQPDGRAVVVDFGLARAATPGRSAETRDDLPDHGPQSSSPRLTEAGAVVGTRGYIAPELRAGSEATVKSDQYAFCVALHEAVVGEPPRSTASGVVPSANVVGWLRSILARGLDPSPDRRWASMAALLSALKAGRKARLRRRVAAAALGTATVALAWWGADDSTSPCRDDPTIASVWNDGVRARLGAEIVRAGEPASAALHQRLATLIDERVTAWHTAFAQVCARERELAPARLHAAKQCLQGEEDELAAMLELVLDDPTRANVHHAVGALPGMGSPAICSDDRWLARHEASAAADPDQRELRRRLWHARALGIAGRYAEASRIAEDVARQSEARDDAPLHAAAVIELGRLADADGDPRRAREALEQAYYLAIETSADDEALEAATELVFLTGHELRQDEEATRWAERAASTITRLHLDGQAPQAAVLRAVGAVHRDFGRFDEATAAAEQALEILQASNAAHPLMATLHADLGSVLYSQGRYAEAEQRHGRAVQLRRELLGPEHPSVAIALGELGTMQLGQKRFADAVKTYDEALAIADASLGPAHVDAARIRGNLAPALMQQGRFAEAVEQFTAAQAVYEATLGPDHPDVAAILHGLAHAYRSMRHFEEAERTATRAITILEQELGAEHVAVATAVGGLATVYLEQDRPDRAQPLLERVLAIRERHLAPDHPDIGGVLTNLGNAKLAQADVEAAERDYDRALQILEGALGPDAPILAYPLWSRARARDAQGRTAEALEDAERALSLRRAAAVADWEIAESQQQVAMLLRKEGRDPARVSTLAEQAMETFVAGGDATAKQREELAAWLSAPETDDRGPRSGSR